MTPTVSETIWVTCVENKMSEIVFSFIIQKIKIHPNPTMYRGVHEKGLLSEYSLYLNH